MNPGYIFWQIHSVRWLFLWSWGPYRPGLVREFQMPFTYTYTAIHWEKSGAKTAPPWSCFGKWCHFGGWSRFFPLKVVPKYCHRWNRVTYHERTPGVELFWLHFFLSVQFWHVNSEKGLTLCLLGQQLRRRNLPRPLKSFLSISFKININLILKIKMFYSF